MSPISTTPPKNPGFDTAKSGCHAMVTGSSGFVGARLVEMLLERGAKTVIAFDIVPPSPTLMERFEDVQAKSGGKIITLSQSEGDLCSDSAVEAAFQKVPQLDVVFHIAALVGPFHKREMYYKVNYEGTLRIIDNCKKYKVPKLVYSSSPSTRFTGGDVENLTEDDMHIPDTFVALYAETKARGEEAVHKACDNETFLTVSVAPHQVYGPHDSLFLPKFLETAGSGKLRIFGKGDNIISLCHNDNYCHGLLCGADALYKDSPALRKYYVVTDDQPQYIWKIINSAAVAMGFADLEKKFHLPVWLLYSVAYFCNFLTLLTGKHFKLKPFTVKMMIINRYFNIKNAKRDLQYQPLKTFDEGWKETIDWFKVNWLPQYKEMGAKEL
ncbi:nucleoside-diphosphate-sugar epimerase [Nitzschia inconspicua]|uniref:Nucleoside-diphosphate-sugar epimerase n=1 Tax=Nitzschia inconspicua TaxID=303405 RepID=A0A9K3KLL6_9STRA|nr:nucleoside-diphosphate-sugar epimerase [Nitzschia inconspicua]